ncbi:hypothetical protein JYU34_005703 [Plutella xylostella]|uniref:Uncharacterized protein n=1 Tax=Plutella xylostella TaxID=51655 RepID=A0ABQ7QTX4_PLUXY|nr:hypothetical protein JYU34_005703 [Plutella xylostella]
MFNRLSECNFLWIIIIFNFLQLQGKMEVACHLEENEEDNDNKLPDLPDGPAKQTDRPEVQLGQKGGADDECEKTCYININGKEFFTQMNKLYKANKAIKDNYENAVRHEIASFQEALLASRGVAKRAPTSFGGDPDSVPAGLNLGGDRWMQTDNRSVLFFHRMKLRNKTHFQMEGLSYSFNSLTCRLRLQDLRLRGTFERLMLDPGASFFYQPTFGTADLLLQDVRCTMVARLRLDAGRLRAELMKSSGQDLLQVDDHNVRLTYDDNESNKEPETITLTANVIRNLKDKIRNDLNEWIKDYFNDYYAYHGPQYLADDRYQKFDNDRIGLTNNYTDNVIKTLRQRLPRVLELPDFTITTVNAMRISLTSGTVQGLNSLHRRSMATDFLDTRFNRRVVETVVGFSGVRLTYKFEVKFDQKTKRGNFHLTFNEITSHMCLMLYNSKQKHKLYFNDIEMSEPAAAVDGEAQQHVARFKYLVEHELKTILKHLLREVILKMRYITECDYPRINKLKPSNNIFGNSNTSEEPNEG